MLNNHLIAEKLFITQSVLLNLETPFVWTSGIKSPIYCDNRKLLSYPIHRDFIKSELSNCVLDNFPETDLIAGVATAGIPWGVLVADQIKTSFLYVRSQSKKHGLGKNIEGHYTPNQKILVVEDLISTGKSSIEAVQILQNEGLQVLGVMSIFNYGFPSTKEKFDALKIPFISLIDYTNLIAYAQSKEMFTDNNIKKLNSWRENPEDWN